MAASMNVIKPSSGQCQQGIVVALLDLPPRTVLGLDGQSVVLKRDDFVGITEVPRDASFHLVTVRAGSLTKNSGIPSPDGAAAITVAFYVSSQEQALARKYDPQTEEVSSNPLDEGTTANLLNEIHAKRLDPQRTVSYDQFVPVKKVEEWRDLTSFVCTRLLQKRGILPGGKIVPGAYGFDEDDVNKPLSEDVDHTNEDLDGKSVVYPRIPVMDSSQSARTHSRHLGTKHFMAALSPAERTSFFLDTSPGSRALEHVLTSYYNNQCKEILGDVQLSYVLFLHLHCFSSLEHWRDLLAMFSVVDLEEVAARLEVYSNLLSILSSQVITMERDFFDDAEMSGDTFLAPALQRLISTLSRVDDDDLTTALLRFKALLVDRFPGSFDAAVSSGGNTIAQAADSMQVYSEEEEDDEAPVVVSSEEIEASFARSVGSPFKYQTYPASERHQFPLLFAAVMPHEDVLMTCARALDNASDVSLVREAAAYLEQVESNRDDDIWRK
jgi:A1 cistron-splicing factor AAR2